MMAAERTGNADGARGKTEALETLFLALEGPLLCYAERLVRDADLAQDIVQEAFLQLCRHVAEVDAPRRWLYRTVHNLGLNHLRAMRRIVPLAAAADPGGEPMDASPDPQPLPDEQLARWEGIGLVRLGLEALDPRSREVVRLKFQEGLSYREIAGRTGLTVGNVGYLLHHAVKSLAADLSRAGLIA